ncbi:MAG: class I SAM-dependent methyltransferase [Gemmatimonadetes bacterium]|nr:class I SAM-dependent methyltransferase [Gemmatimonadota bacterium]
MPAESARSAYDAWHTRYGVDAESDAPWHRLVKQHLDRSRHIHGKRVLEIGSGRGGFACWLAGQAEKPATLVAADFARTAVHKGKNFAHQRGVFGIRWAIGDIQMLAHPANRFDTIISCETIEHVPDPRRALRELARVLKPGGRLYLTTPNYLGTMGLYRMYLRLTGRRYTEEGQPINHPVILPRTVTWVRRAGLMVLAIDAVGHYLPFPGRPPIEIPALNRPRRLMRWFGLHSLVVATKLTAGP